MIAPNSKPLILVTNDDGVHAKGIESLIEMVKPYGDVVVVAPDAAQSAMSHAITVKTPLYFSCIEKGDGYIVYKSNGTPADCIKLALNVILDRKPDICVSGINHGTNSSVSVHYSGTLAGAREAAFYGIPCYWVLVAVVRCPCRFFDGREAFQTRFRKRIERWHANQHLFKRQRTLPH
jgi:5'-nucleotidase